MENDSRQEKYGYLVNKDLGIPYGLKGKERRES
jgi:hypothetical protein